MNNDNYEHEFFRTTSVQDFKLEDVTKAPAGYPSRVEADNYSKEIFAETYEERKAEFIKYVLKNPSNETVKGFFYELIRLSENRKEFHKGKILAAINYINERRDCADFALAGIIRMYYQFIDNQLISDELKKSAKQAILDFKYWPDEPGIDSMCYWTENHHIIFSSNELLAGQLFPNEIFSNSGMTGKEKIIKATKKINKWLELRFYTGFNEWLSNVYFDEDFPALTNLLDFSENREIAEKANTIIDLMLLDMASNSYYGQFTCTHGRTYTKDKIHPHRESIIDTSKLMFGMGKFTNEDNMSAVTFALSPNFRLPKAIYKVATDINRSEWINKQRVSIKFKDAKKWGYGKLDLESAMGLLSFGGYSHHRTINHMILMLDEFRWWENKFFLEFKPFKKAIQVGKKIGLTNVVAYIMRKDLSRNSFEEANIYTYRTPNYMISTAQNYRKGYGGDQHHIWQATLDDEAVVFTTHPGGYGLTAPDAYWHGNGFMPKSIQHKNVNITIYNIPKMPTIVLAKTLEFTHAFFPRDRFDSVVEKDGWVFGEKNDGYIAMYSRNKTTWADEGEYKDQDLIAKGRKNIWITEMGRKDIDESFSQFIEKILNAKITFNGLNVCYNSPSVGEIKVGWSKELKIGGQKKAIKDYKRYENPSCNAEFESNSISISYRGETHSVKYDK